MFYFQRLSRLRVTFDPSLVSEMVAESKKEQIPQNEGRREHNAADLVHL